MHAVAEQPVVAGEALEALWSVGVADAFAYVYVDADTEVLGQPGGRFERLVTAGEGGVHGHHSGPARLDEVLVLGEAAAGTIGAVPIRDPIAGEHPDADLLAGLGDDFEAALDRVW